MNDWMVDGTAVERVHSGVMRRIRRRRSIRRGAVVAALFALALFRVPEAEERLTLVPPRPPAAPEWVAPPPPVAPVVMARAVPRPAERITIFTDDPNVVIVLVGEGGDE